MRATVSIYPRTSRSAESPESGHDHHGSARRGHYPQPGSPEVIPVPSLRLNEHYRGLLTASCLSIQLCFPARLRAPLSRLLPSSFVASSSLLSPDADGALRLAGDHAPSASSIPTSSLASPASEPEPSQSGNATVRTGATSQRDGYGRRIAVGVGAGRSAPFGAGKQRQVSVRRSWVILSPAATTAAACMRPGERVSRSIGPDTETAAITRPPGPRTGADTEATPGSRSAAVAAQPRRRTWASVVAVNLAPRSPRDIRAPSSQASRTWAAEPAVIGSAAPTGTVSRRPLVRSAAATQMRLSACALYSWALSPVTSLSCVRMGCAT